MADIEHRKVIMAGPMRWVVLTADREPTTLAWFVKVHYTIKGGGNVLFARSDLQGNGHYDIFAVFSDNPVLAEHARDDIFDYTVFAGVPDQAPPAPIVKAAFESQDKFPEYLLESMVAEDGTTLALSLRCLGPPTAYIRAVSERVTEVGAYAVPDEFSLEINGVAPAGQPEAGPLADAPPVGADLQNLWYEA